MLAPSTVVKAKVLGLLLTSLLVLSFTIAGALPTSAQDVVRIALPTKTYYPTIIAETALRQKLFAKENIKAELTVYRGGAEAFEAVAAGAADITLGSVAIVAAGIKKGVQTKGFAGSALGYYGWYLSVKADSKITSPKDLDGKKVGITSAGSGSDLLAQWTMTEHKVKFTRVPLGGGGLVPNLISGNVDAVVLYSPLTFKVFQEKTARPILDYGKEVPPHLTGVWVASDKMLKERPQVVQRTANALYGAMISLKESRAEAIKLIAEIDEIAPSVAEAELDGNILKLSTTGEIRPEWIGLALDLAAMIGMKDLAPADQTYINTLKITPTRP